MRFNPNKPQKAPPLPKGAIPSPITVSHVPVLIEKPELKGIELHFPTKPSPATLALFHAAKTLPPSDQWHFHFKKKYWYAHDNPVTRAFANNLIGGDTIPVPDSALPTPHPALGNIVPVNFSPEVATTPAIHHPPSTILARPPMPAWRQRLLQRP